jgi:type I restriction enzyme M protein
VKKVRPATVEGNGTSLAATWAAFDEQGREFWSQMDALVHMLGGAVAKEADDA